jgi:hypothetical protein
MSVRPSELKSPAAAERGPTPVKAATEEPNWSAPWLRSTDLVLAVVRHQDVRATLPSKSAIATDCTGLRSKGSDRREEVVAAPDHRHDAALERHHRIEERSPSSAPSAMSLGLPENVLVDCRTNVIAPSLRRRNRCRPRRRSRRGRRRHVVEIAGGDSLMTPPSDREPAATRPPPGWPERSTTFPSPVATAASRVPSPSKSPLATSRGFVVTVVDPLSTNVPSPWLSHSRTRFSFQSASRMSIEPFPS